MRSRPLLASPSSATAPSPPGGRLHARGLRRAFGSGLTPGRHAADVPNGPTTPRRLPILLALSLGVLWALLLLVPRPAAAQSITHASTCHPQGSDAYPVGDTLIFRYEPDDPPPELPPTLPKLPLYPFPPCVEVSLHADGVTGRPPLRFTWQAPDGRTWAGNPVALDTGTLPTGVSTMTLTVRNDWGEAVEAVNLWIPELAGPLAAPEAAENPTAGLTTQVRAQARGAHEWRWDFGDGTGTPWQVPCGFTATVASHTYARPGSYAVVAYARNCRDGTVASEPLLVTVGGPDTIEILTFQAQGCSTFCIFDRGEEVRFTVETNAPPDRYLYDWDGDGTVDQVTTSPVGHRYGEFGVYTPRLIVERGTGRDERVHGGFILVD